MKSTLFLHPPSLEGFDGGAGSRYQARREVRSFYYPTWLAQAAALVPGSRLIDAPPRCLGPDDVLRAASQYEHLVIHTSTPSFRSDARLADAFRAAYPDLLIGFVGPHVAVQGRRALERAAGADYVAGADYEFAVLDAAQGVPLEQIEGLTFRKDGSIASNPPRAALSDMDLLPHVVDVYRRDLIIEDYYNGYLFHPYVSFYTGRGCKSRCTYCLWPQTIGGHAYRVRSIPHVVEEVRKAQDYFPQMAEVFFDDDTLTDNLPRVEALARALGALGLRWSCNAKGNVPFETLRVMKENGLRLLVVGYESGDQRILHNVKKGMLIERARRFTEDCHMLGIKIHGAFIMGLPGETRETIRETIAFAKSVNPYTIQVSVAAAYPGTELYEQARAEGWLVSEDGDELLGEDGFQLSSLAYPDLGQEEILDAADELYRKFYLRPAKMAELFGGMVRNAHEFNRRMREGTEFFRYLSRRRASTGHA